MPWAEPQAYGGEDRANEIAIVVAGDQPEEPRVRSQPECSERDGECPERELDVGPPRELEADDEDQRGEDRNEAPHGLEQVAADIQLDESMHDEEPNRPGEDPRES
ncbi:hypothetical protein D3C87_1894200 [compost metagenome]